MHDVLAGAYNVFECAGALSARYVQCERLKMVIILSCRKRFHLQLCLSVTR